MIDKITFKNYKLFKEKQMLELKPITVLIGKNNTGKSAVMKLPILISNGLKGQPFNINYKIEGDSENTVELGTDLQDLVYNRSEIGMVNIGVSNDKNSIEVGFNKQYGILEYNLNQNDIDITSEKINGFLIDGKKFDDLQFEIDYLGAIRVEPNSSYNFSNEEFQVIGIKGQNAYHILIKDFKSDGSLLECVSGWYKENFESWELEILENKLTTETTYEIAIKNSKLNSVNIKQTGQGIQQVLPLIVRSFMKDETPSLIIIEEPETHLHPAAHGNLAQRLVESYLNDKNKNYLIETHSENFILRLQALIADPEIKFSVDDLKVYYVDYIEEDQCSELKDLKIEVDGEIEDWPDNVFNENLDEVFRLRRNQKKAQDNASSN